jgi:cytochrome c biogenesis protein CcmG, thiol:disulfide interchange protein DsbE
MPVQDDPLRTLGEGAEEEPPDPEGRLRGGWRWKLAAVVLAGAVLVAFVVVGLASSGKSPRRAPELPSQVLVGPRPTIASMLAAAHGAPVLVVFWASWCGPCEQEARAVARFAAGSSGRGRIVGVDWSDTASGARSFIRRFAWSFPNVRDPVGTVGDSYRLAVLPTTFVIGADRLIKHVLRGPQTEATLTSALASAS